jgi:hypothetical protein
VEPAGTSDSRPSLSPDALARQERERRMAARLLEQSRLSQELLALRDAALRQKRNLGKP